MELLKRISQAFRRRRLRYRVCNEGELIEYLSNYSIVDFTQSLITQLKEEVYPNGDLDYDGYVFYVNEFLKIADRNQEKLNGVGEIAPFDDFGNVINFLMSLYDVSKPGSTLYVEQRSPKEAMEINLSPVIQLGITARNKVYIGKRKISPEHFYCWQAFLRKWDDEITKTIGIGPSEFDYLLLLFAEKRLRTDDNYILEKECLGSPMEKIEAFKKIICGDDDGLMAHCIKGAIFAPEPLLIEEQSFHLLMKRLKVFKPSLVEKIYKERGKFLEQIVAILLKKIGFKTFLGVYVNGLETDVLAQSKQGYLVVEAKAPKVDIDTFETGKDNGIKKEIIKAMHQVETRAEVIKGREFRVSKTAEDYGAIFKADNAEPLVVTFDDVFDLADENASEAKRKGFCTNVLTLCLDDLFQISHECHDTAEFMRFVKERNTDKKGRMHGLCDEYFQFLRTIGHSQIIKSGYLLGSFDIRMEKYAEAFKKILSKARE